MTHESAPYTDLGYAPRSRQYRPVSNTRPAAKTPPPARPQPKIDPDVLNAPAENDFTRWYAEQCAREGRRNVLEKHK